MQRHQRTSPITFALSSIFSDGKRDAFKTQCLEIPTMVGTEEIKKVYQKDLAGRKKGKSFILERK